MIPPFDRADAHAAITGVSLGAAAREIIAGLQAKQAFVSPKYFYDVLGSRLFEAITDLPEYYPTRTESAILARHAAQIAVAAGTESTLVELGAGNCEKARSLLRMLRPVQYAAVDISAEFLRGALAGLQRDFPGVETLSVGTDFSDGIELPSAVRRARRLFCYLGSSIGNFTPAQAAALLAQLRGQCRADGGLLIGVDLLKSEAVLHAAYNDALGVTAAFNLNVLNHLNALAATDFRLDDWQHRAFFNAPQSRIEMHLEAKRDVYVSWPGGGRRFAKGNAIHTENSYKYRLQDFQAMLQRAGFTGVSAWTDERRWFAVFHARAGYPHEQSS